jgi:hypothetical protein
VTRKVQGEWGEGDGAKGSGWPMAEYKKCVFTFMDVLGFGSLVDNETDPDKIAEILSTLTDSAKPSVETAEMYEIDFLTFSDSTIRSIHINSETNKKHRLGIFFHELHDLVFAQANMVDKGYFVRGGVTVGDICIDGQMVFGPAIVKAYRLESEFAVYPRIVIDPALFDEFERSELLRNKRHDLETERAYIADLVRRDSDGLYFVDYLKAILQNLDEYQDIAYLSTHKERILEAAESHMGLNKIAAKSLWAATYHNTVINELSDEFFEQFDASKQDLLISQSDIALVYDL